MSSGFTTSNQTARRAVRRWIRPTSEWTSFDHGLIRLAASFILFGVLALVLPAFGLQFQKLSKLGSAGGAAVGWGLIGLGGALAAYVIVLRGRMLRFMAWSIAGGVVAIIGVIGLSAWLASRPPPRFPLPPPPGVPLPPSAANGPYGEPGHRPPGIPAPPSQPARRTPAEAYADLCARFGAQRVVRVRFQNAMSDEVSKHIRATAKSLISGTESSWSVRTDGGAPLLLIAPVEDVDAFVRALDVGKAEIDRATRTLRVSVDRDKLRKAE